MKGKTLKYFGLYLSFIGWSILCLLSCGLGFIVLNPYVNTSLTIFYEEALSEGIRMGKIKYVILKDNSDHNNIQADAYNNDLCGNEIVSVENNDQNF